MGEFDGWLKAKFLTSNGMEGGEKVSKRQIEIFLVILIIVMLTFAIISTITNYYLDQRIETLEQLIQQIGR
jgi:hypothetical protein